jgi:hypothetical protein
MLAHGHFDKTLALNIRVYCQRSHRSLDQWKLRTHEKLNAAYRARLVEYQDALAESEFDQNLNVNIESRPEAINRRTEREELKKWSIKTFRNKVIDFSAIADVEGINEVDPNAADENARPIQFYEEAFEWEQMSYFFYPYFWGRRDYNALRRSFTDIDSRYEAFLRAGAARVIVPVTPGYEKRVIMYLTADNTLDEIEKISLASEIDDDETPIEVDASEYKTLWVELLQDRKDGIALGSGTLQVRKGQTRIDINDDSIWEVREIDIGREIFIRGDRYEIAQIDSTSNSFELGTEYQAEDEDRAVYVTGSVPFGPPWTVNLPTNLVVLDENKDRISIE